jgi:hypothetical protein
MPPQPPTPNNEEINKALKEFETKSNEGQTTPVNKVQGIITPQNTPAPTKQIEGVSFDTGTETDHYKAIKLYEETTTPKMVKAVMKLSGGKIKDQRQAKMILLGFVLVIVCVSVFLVFFENRGVKVSPMTPEQKSYMETGHGL